MGRHQKNVVEIGFKNFNEKILTRAVVEKLVEWTEKELEHYREKDELPSHRNRELSIKTNLHNLSQGCIKDVHVGDFSIHKVV